MIFIPVAMMCEAKPIIEKFNLKKSGSGGSFRIYENQDIKLIVTGTGGLHACVCTTNALALYKAKKEDCLINIGVAGCSQRKDSGNEIKEGDMFLGNKIVNKSFSREYYPDMILDFGLEEAQVTTLKDVWRYDDKDLFDQNTLLDMEAAFVYESARHFLYSHNIFVLKIVSDFGNDHSSPGPENIKNLINLNVDRISEFVEKVERWQCKNSKNGTIINKNIKKARDITKDLRFTEYEKNEMDKLIGMYIVRHREITDSSDSDFLSGAIEKISKITGESLPVKEKHESREAYGKIQRFLRE